MRRTFLAGLTFVGVACLSSYSFVWAEPPKQSDDKKAESKKDSHSTGEPKEAASGQQDKQGMEGMPEMSPEMQKQWEAWMKYATPGKYHEIFKPMAGDWKASCKSWLQGPKGEPASSEGTVKKELTFDGRYLVEHHEGQMGGQTFGGMSVLAYDNQKQQYVGSWIDSMGTGIYMSTGSYDEGSKTLTMHMAYTDPVNDKPKTSRWTIKIVDDNSQVFTFYETDEKGQEYVHAETTLTRVK